MPTYILEGRTSIVRTYRITAPDPKAAVDAWLEGEETDDETDEGESITSIFEENDGVLKDLPLPDNAR